MDLSSASLIPADGLLIMAAHASRAKIFTEWLDPSVLDESDPSKRDAELDLFDPSNPNQPPYSRAYIARYRAAQVARNRRITSWAREQLAVIDGRAQSGSESNNWRRHVHALPKERCCCW